MKTIGIDIGTTTISLVCYDTEKRAVLSSSTVLNNSTMPSGSGCESIQNPDTAVFSAKAALDFILEKHPDVEAIGLTGQMHGILYVDAEGHSVSPLYTWKDQRGLVPLADNKSIVQLIYEKTGDKIPAGYGLVTHMYLEEQLSVPKNAVTFCTIPDYLGMILTCKNQPLIHPSMAASFGFFGKSCLQFNRDHLSKMDMDIRMLPEITKDVVSIGTYHGIPVASAIGDNQASFLGTVGFQKGTPLINIGTGGQVAVLSDHLFEQDGIEARPYLDGKYIIVGSSLCGGRAYAVLESFFRSYAVAAGADNVSQYDTMKRLLENSEAEETGSPLSVCTAFEGTRTNPEMRGSIQNIGESNFTPANMIRGVLTGIVSELYDMFKIIQSGTGIQVNSLIGAGNGLRKNRELQQVTEKMFGKKLILSESIEEAACGAAIAATMLH